MATTTDTNAADTATGPEGDQCVAMVGVDWDGYTAVLRVRGERSRPKLLYLDGNLSLMSPAYPHSFFGKRLGQLVMVVVEELDIPCVPAGETTFRREEKRGGAEGDETFYLGHASRIVGVRNLRLPPDPPPDLVIEVVNTHAADSAVEVWRRFGVPEVWVCDGKSLTILSLQPDGRYSEVKSGVAFPFLGAGEILEWVNKPLGENETDTDWIKQLRAWVRDTLVPRVREPRRG